MFWRVSNDMKLVPGNWLPCASTGAYRQQYLVSVRRTYYVAVARWPTPLRFRSQADSRRKPPTPHSTCINKAVLKGFSGGIAAPLSFC